METLQAFLANSQRRDIHAIATYIQRHIDADWQNALDDTYQKMVELYPQIGDSAYATYNKRLFQHVHDQLKQAGFKAVPQLPGDLMISREWGQDEQNRQRWMWSQITTTDSTPIGTIAVVVYHDHEQIRIPRAFQVIAMEEADTQAVIERLSAISDEFTHAPDMKTEVEQYLAAHPQSDNQ